MLYSTFGGADFAAGFWDLTAGDSVRGRRPRALIDQALGPVWEANHVWLIFCLVVLSTAFPPAFAEIMTTLSVPLGLAAFGIVLRGSGFASRKMLVRTAEQRASGAAFAASSVITPFWFGTVAGGIASGRVPGRGTAPYLNPTSLLGGAVAVVACAYLAAVFLSAEARLRGAADLETWFGRRAVVTAAVAGALALGGIAVLRRCSSPLRPALRPRPAVAPALGGPWIRGARSLAPGRSPPGPGAALAAAAAVVLGWAWRSTPTCSALISPSPPPPLPAGPCGLTAIAAAVALCGPSLVLLYLLQERGPLKGSLRRHSATPQGHRSFADGRRLACDTFGSSAVRRAAVRPGPGTSRTALFLTAARCAPGPIRALNATGCAGARPVQR